MKRTTAGLSILAGGLAFVGGVNASDLLVNGSFELPRGGTNSGWNGYYLQYNQTDAYYAGPAIPASEIPGGKYSWRHSDVNGGWGAFTTPDVDDTQALIHSINQTVALTNALTIPAIDAGHGQFTFSAWLASYTKNPEQPYVKVVFWDASQTNQVGQPAVFDRGVVPGTPQPYWVGNADPADTTSPDNSNHQWAKFVDVDQVPVGARYATVYVTRSFNSGRSGSPDTYVDLVKLDVIDVTTSTAFKLALPVDGATGVSASSPITVVLSDISKQVDPASIRLTVNGVAKTPTVTKSGTDTTVQFIPTTLFPSQSTNSFQITWSDTSTPPVKQSKSFSFQVYTYVDVELGTALYTESFNGVAEGSLPAGWSVSNQTDSLTPGQDLTNPSSDSYADWVVISRNTLLGLFTADSYLTSALNVAPGQVVNGAVVTNLIDVNFAFADARRGGHQVQMIQSPDFDLSGKTNVYLAFNSLYAQSSGKLGAVEYSTDAGQSWQPALYLLAAGDIVYTAAGNPDGYQTLTANHGNLSGDGTFGQYLGTSSNQWANIGPFISPRTGDVTSSQRVEVIRLAAADGKSTVRVRFTQIASGGWFFGIDNVGLYSLPKPSAPLLASTPGSVIAGVGNSARFDLTTPLGVGPFTYQWLLNGSPLSGRTNQSLVFQSVQLSDAGSYQVVASNAGGSVTSTVPSVLTVLPATAHVTGQWDFAHGDLRATVGRDLEYYDDSVKSTTQFGTTTSFGILDVAGAATPVMYFTPTSGNAGGAGGSNPTTDAWGGYKMFHGAAANGGGTNVNQYTLIFDVLYPTESDQSWRAILQASTTATTGEDDSEYYINLANGIGISGDYYGSVTPNVWHRLAIAVDMAGPGPNPVVEKFVDGVKAEEQTGGLDSRDGRFSLNPTLSLLFAENNGYNNDAYVSSVQFLNGRLSDSAIASLGGATPTKIPGGLAASITGTTISIAWSGAVLESATSLNGPWTPVTGAAKPYTVSAPSAGKFYRSR